MRASHENFTARDSCRRRRCRRGLGSLKANTLPCPFPLDGQKFRHPHNRCETIAAKRGRARASCVCVCSFSKALNTQARVARIMDLRVERGKMKLYDVSDDDDDDGTSDHRGGGNDSLHIKRRPRDCRVVVEWIENGAQQALWVELEVLCYGYLDG